MAGVDITGRLREWVKKAIDSACMGEEFWFDLSTETIRTPVGATMRWTVVVTMKSPLLNQGPIVVPFQLGFKSMREDLVKAAIQQALATLRQTYRKILDDGPKALDGPMPKHGQS